MSGFLAVPVYDSFYVKSDIGLSCQWHLMWRNKSRIFNTIREDVKTRIFCWKLKIFWKTPGNITQKTKSVISEKKVTTKALLLTGNFPTSLICPILHNGIFICPILKDKLKDFARSVKQLAPWSRAPVRKLSFAKSINFSTFIKSRKV